MSFWDKKNRNKKTNYDISKETGIPEEKVKEIMKGEREVPTDRVDTLNKALETSNKAERSIRILNAKGWLKKTDLSRLRLSWGYISQKEVAEAIGMAQSSYSLIESKKYDILSNNSLLKVYDFFNDELNKKVSKGLEKVNKGKGSKASVVSKEALDWYNNTDIKALLKEHNISQRQLGLKLGYADGTMVCKAVLGKRVGGDIIDKLYQYFINGKVEDSKVEDSKVENKEEVIATYESKVDVDKDTIIKNQAEQIRQLEEIIKSLTDSNSLMAHYRF